MTTCFIVVRAPSVEGQHRTCDLARLHRAECLVDVLEPPAPGHHLVEQQPALAIEIEIERDVNAEPVAPHPRGLHTAFGADGHPRKLDRRIGWQDADDRGRAADGEALDGLAYELGVTD